MSVRLENYVFDYRVIGFLSYIIKWLIGMRALRLLMLVYIDSSGQVLIKLKSKSININ